MAKRRIKVKYWPPDCTRAGRLTFKNVSRYETHYGKGRALPVLTWCSSETRKWVLFKVKSSLQSRVLIQHSSADSGWWQNFKWSQVSPDWLHEVCNVVLHKSLWGISLNSLEWLWIVPFLFWYKAFCDEVSPVEPPLFFLRNFPIWKAKKWGLKLKWQFTTTKKSGPVIMPRKRKSKNTLFFPYVYINIYKNQTANIQHNAMCRGLQESPLWLPSHCYCDWQVLQKGAERGLEHRQTRGRKLVPSLFLYCWVCTELWTPPVIHINEHTLIKTLKKKKKIFLEEKVKVVRY